MSYLALDQEELSLLRLTSDLYFVEESPLFFLQSSALNPAFSNVLEANDERYQIIFERLLDKGIIDEKGFKLRDPALDRLAPVSECEACVHFRSYGLAQNSEVIFYLLDEIAVQYFNDRDVHVFGNDLDPRELRNFFGRRLSPSRAFYTPLDFTLSRKGFELLMRLLDTPRPDHLSRAAVKGLASRHDSIGTLFSMLHAPTSGPAGSAIRELRRKKLLIKRGPHLFSLNSALLSLFASYQKDTFHHLTRRDFIAKEEVDLRQLFLMPLKGSLASIELSKRTVRFKELNSASLEILLSRALGPPS